MLIVFFAVLLPVVLTIAFFTMRKSEVQIALPAQQNISKRTVVVSSQIPGLTVEKMDESFLSLYLSRLGLSSFTNIPFIGKTGLISLQQITVTLKPLTERKKSGETHLLSVNDRITYITGTLSSDGATMEIPIYIGSSMFEGSSDVSLLLTDIVLQSLFYNFQTEPLGNLKDPYMSFLAKVKSMDRPIFHITFKKPV